MEHQLVINELFDGTDDNDYGGMDCNLYNSIVNFLKTGKYPTVIENHQKLSRNALFHWRMRCAKFMLSAKDTLLYMDKQNSKNGRVVVKRGEVKIAIKVVHERSGHVGQKQTQSLISTKLYWNGMRKDIARYISECSFCRTLKAIKQPNEISLNLPNEEVKILDRLQLNINVSNITNLPSNYTNVKLTPCDKDINSDVDSTFSLNNQRLNNKRSLTLSSEPLGGIDSLLVSANQQNEPSSNSWLSFDDYANDMNNEFAVSTGSEARKRKFTETRLDQSSEMMFENHISISDEFQDGENFFPDDSQRYETEGISTTHPLIIQAVDKEVIKLQKKVLGLQHEVLLLKKEYLKKKLDSLGSKESLLNVTD